MSQSIVLRHLQDSSGSSHLQATVTAVGDLIIEGQDLGEGVESFWGEGLTEYEFTMTVRAADVPQLLAALGAQDDLLTALYQQLHSQISLGVGQFLDAHEIPYEFWSRVGDCWGERVLL